MCLLTLRGLPPLIGSALKLVGIITLVEDLTIRLGLLILSSVVRLFYYLRVLFRVRLVFNSNLFFQSGRLEEYGSISHIITLLLVFRSVLGLIMFLTIIVVIWYSREV